MSSVWGSGFGPISSSSSSSSREPWTAALNLAASSRSSSSTSLSWTALFEDLLLRFGLDSVDADEASESLALPELLPLLLSLSLGLGERRRRFRSRSRVLFLLDPECLDLERDDELFLDLLDFLLDDRRREDLELTAFLRRLLRRVASSLLESLSSLPDELSSEDDSLAGDGDLGFFAAGFFSLSLSLIFAGGGLGISLQTLYLIASRSRFRDSKKSSVSSLVP